MPHINFGGLASGLPPNIVDQLMQAERIPLNQMKAKKATDENRMKLVQELQGKLSKVKGSLGKMADVNGFSAKKLTSGDENILAGTVDPNAAANGSWNIEVKSLAQKAAALTNGFPDKDKTQLGVGYFKFETEHGEKEVYINGKNNTLQGVANAINSASVGVKASVVQDRTDPDNPFRLMISSDGVGADHQVKYPTLYLLDGDQDVYFDKQREAKNAVISVDGFEFQESSNSVKDVIPGVTLDLKQASPGRTVNLSVSEDKTKISGEVKTFVDSVNEVLSFIQKQNALTKDSDTRSTLGGDGMLRDIEDRLRRLIQEPQYGLGSKITQLDQLGVEFNRNGTLDLKEDKFKSMLAKSPEDVRKFLVGDGFNSGFITSTRRTINTVLDAPFGSIPLRTQSLRDKIQQIDNQISDKERQLAQKEQHLRQKFSHLEETMSKLKSQGGALARLGGGGGLLGSLQSGKG